jgi:hypothetical protein
MNQQYGFAVSDAEIGEQAMHAKSPPAETLALAKSGRSHAAASAPNCALKSPLRNHSWGHAAKDVSPPDKGT